MKLPPLVHGVLTLLLLSTSASFASVFTIDKDTTYQTMRGWGWVNSLPDYLTDEYREELIHEIVEQYGLTRMRFEIPAGSKTESRRWEWSNDDTDPMSISWRNLNLAEFDERMLLVVLPFVRAVRARGEPFHTYVSPSFYNGGSSGPPQAWLLNHPGEYAEFALSMLLRLKYLYDIEADYHCILNEASYNNVFTLDVVRKMIDELGPRMEAAGLSTKIQFPESLNADIAYNNFIVPTADDDELWSWVGCVSYHRYGGMNRLGDLAAYAESRGVPTAFTEHSHLTLDRMFLDLKVGNVSYWEVYAIGSEISVAQPNYNFLERTGTYYWRFRQVMYHVRPGAVRIEATSDGNGDLLAWLQNGQTLLNIRDFTGDAEIEGLTPGTYALSSARLTAPYIEEGLHTVGSDGKLSLPGLQQARFYTLYPHPGGNLAPNFTDFRPSVGFLVAPESSVTLSAAAQDPELDPLTFAWSIISTPAGADVVLDSPDTASTQATGLTEPGMYTFEVTVTDGTNVTTRRVRTEVFASNIEPTVFTIQNRIPVRVTVADGETQLRAAVFNPEGDPITYQWSIAAQPPGGDAQFSEPTSDRTQATNLTVPGDYVFRMTVSDGNTNSFTEHTVTVYANNVDPVITSAVATPSSISLPESTTTLSGSHSDAEGNPVTTWWRYVAGPDGARPTIVDQAATTTEVKGLVVPGTYTFEYIVADEFGADTQGGVSVNVSAGNDPALLYVNAPNGGERFSAGQTVRIRWASNNLADNVRIEFHDGESWSTIFADTENDGSELWTVPSRHLDGCQLRISSVTTPDIADVSDEPFRVVGEEALRILGLDGSDSQGPRLRWATRPGGFGYAIEHTETLKPGDWTPLDMGSATAPSPIEMELRDPDTSGIKQRFYRVRERAIQ